MTDSTSEIDVESEASSMDGVVTKGQLLCRIDSLQQENLVLKAELETSKLRIKSLIQENETLRRNSVSIQAKAEQEEEYISNTLMKQIQTLKKEKETLALNYEQEEEYLTNDLTRKLSHLQQEKIALEQTLEREQQAQVNKLLKRIEKLESDVKTKQQCLETLRREKVALENTLEQEQEGLVNRLWKKMERLEAEKRILKESLDAFRSGEGDTSLSVFTSSVINDTSMLYSGAPPYHRHGRTISNGSHTSEGGIVVLPPVMDSPENMSLSVNRLRDEVRSLKQQLSLHQQDYPQQMQTMRQEELALIEENKQLRRRLQYEVQRRQELTRHLSESESSLDMDKQRYSVDQSHPYLLAEVHGPPSTSQIGLPCVGSNLSLSSNVSTGSHFSTQAQAGSLASLSSNASSFVKLPSPVSMEDKTGDMS